VYHAPSYIELSEPDKLVTILVCACGKRLKADGAVPGRVGRCPSCGARFRVPGATPRPAAPAPATDEVLPERAPVGPSAFVSSSGRAASAPQRDGLILPPERPETRLRDTLLYPLWGSTGLGLLAFFPPALWLTSLPMVGAGSVLLSDNLADTTRFGVMFLLPVVPCFALVLGYALLFLGRVLVSSALGEVQHPRWPGWDLDEMTRGVGRWFWAVVIGVVVGGFPALVYWLYCGDIDPLDVIVFAELLAVGAVYAQMALLASILHDDPLAANPITVVRAILRIGWGYARPCLVSGFAVAPCVLAFVGLFKISQPQLAGLAFWAFWVMTLYLAMVALRVLGLCYHRHARALGWFRDRPRWGA
jgi:hypothetical protein